MASQSFQDVKVWQVAHRVHLEIYRLTETFPPRNTYGLASQMRRAAWSIPANIVEGFGRRGTRDKAHFYTTPPAPPRNSSTASSRPTPWAGSLPSTTFGGTARPSPRCFEA